jgi:NADPH2:quinone reductase
VFCLCRFGSQSYHRHLQLQLGSHVEYIAVPWVGAVPVPESVSLATAAATHVSGLTALALLTEAYAVKQGDTILVHTIAGGLGLLLTQIAKARGATVIGTTSSEEKVAVAKAAGADHVVNYKTEETVKRVLEITSDKGVEAVFDSVGKDTFVIVSVFEWNSGWRADPGSRATSRC